MLSHKYWQRSFGGDPSVVGRELSLDGRPLRRVRPRCAQEVGADGLLLMPPYLVEVPQPGLVDFGADVVPEVAHVGDALDRDVGVPGWRECLAAPARSTPRRAPLRGRASRGRAAECAAGRATTPRPR